jgi:hypothetical protein
MTYETIAPQLVELGYDPTPTNGKVPTLEGWQTRPDTALNFDNHQGRNVGIVLGGDSNAITLDVDVPSEPANTIIRDYIKENFPLMPERIGNHPKTLFLCRSKKARRKVKSKKYSYTDPETGEVTENAVEILAEGQQFIGWGLSSPFAELSA